jgi:hypothetical protein
MNDVRNRSLRLFALMLCCFGDVWLAPLHAADLPRTRVAAVRPGTGAVLLTVEAKRRMTSLSAAVPPCRPPLRCPTDTSHGLAPFVLEWNAGTAANVGIDIGDTLRWTSP